MKFLKFLLFFVLFLFIAYLVLCFMGPKHWSVSRSMKMHASQASIYEELVDFGKWPAWSPWHKMDPNMKSTMEGTPGELGHKQSWTSEDSKVGNGSQKLIELRENEFVKSELKMMGEDAPPAFATFELTPDGDSTKVTWAMDGGTSDIPFMMRGFMKIMNIDQMVGDHFNEGLVGLKKVVEAKPAEAALAFEVIDLPQQWYVGIMHPAINVKDITSEMFAKDYAAIGVAIGGMEKMTGMPMDIAHNYNATAGTMDLEIALPVGAEMKVGEGFTCKSIPAGKAAKHIYYGPYNEMGNVWSEFMSAVMKDHVPSWDPYEVYANDPEKVSSPKEIETWLIQPIK